MNKEIIKAMSDTGILDKEENNRLAILAKNGDEKAKEKLILHNCKIISKLAKTLCSNVSLEDDLFNEGVIGLLSAIETYDDSRSSFSTHSYYWIKAIMLKFFKNNSAFHYDAVFYNKLYKYEKLVAATGKNGNFNKNELIDGGLTQEDILLIQKYKRDCVSMDAIISSAGNDIVFGNSDNDKIVDVADMVEEKITQEHLKNALMHEIELKLNEKEKDVILNYYGIDRKPCSLSEISKRYGVSRQYISKVRATAERKLKTSAQLETLVHN